MDELISIGFIKIGEWKISGKDPSRIEHTISIQSDLTDLIYSFVADNQVKYIGMTNSTLFKRMDLYKSGIENGTAGSTNKKVHAEILKLLKSKKKVDIYGLSDVELPSYKGFKVSIASGIELSLIKHFKNSKIDSGGLWNKRGTKGKEKTSIEVIKKNHKTDTSFYINRDKPKEFNNGWISFGKKYHSQLPNKSCDVNLTIGENSSSKKYRFTNSKDNRKINALKDLKDWIATLKDSDKVIVEILNEKAFKIYKE